MKRILRLNLHRESFAQIQFGWHGEKCVLAVEKREGKLAAAWSSRHERLRMPFLQSGTSESCYERDDI